MNATRDQIKKLLTSAEVESWGDPEEGISRAAGEETALHLAEEAFRLATTLLPSRPEPLLDAATLRRAVASRRGDWPEVQRILESTCAVLDEALGRAAPLAAKACLELIQVLRVRELPERVLAIAGDRLGEAVPAAVRATLQHEAVCALLALNRNPEAVAHARAALRAATDTTGEHSHATALAQRALALALAHTRSELDEALALARRASSSANELGKLEGSLNGSYVLGRVLLERGELDEAKDVVDSAMSHDASLLLYRLSAEIAARRGDLRGANSFLSDRIEQVLIASRNRYFWANPDLLPLLEQLAAVLREIPDPEGVVLTLEKFDKIRAAVTGKGPPVRELSAARRAPQSLKAWPRRALSGVFTVDGVDRALADELASAASRESREPGPVHVLMSSSGTEATLVLPSFEDPFRAGHGEGAARYQAALSQVSERMRPRAALRIVPWWTASDTLDLIGELSDAEQERWRSEIFPTLPGWVGGGPGRRSWFGSGIMVSRQRKVPVSASPVMTIWFPRKTRIEFWGSAPAQQLDAWFEAFGRATRLLGADGFTPIAAPSGGGSDAGAPRPR